MRLVRFNYMGEAWTVYLVPDSELHSITDNEEDAALVKASDKEIFFSDSHVNIQTVRHELWHMAYHYRYMHDAELTAEQVEEVSCTQFGHEGPTLVELSAKVYLALDRLKTMMTDSEIKIE